MKPYATPPLPVTSGKQEEEEEEQGEQEINLIFVLFCFYKWLG